jgi:S-adenosylmethionine synthetase
MPTNDSIHVEQLSSKAVSDLDLEIVERKGKGHPDSLIDGASEAVSLALCSYYEKHYGAILHHNVDKGLLVGGRSSPVFGGGEVIEPIYVVVAGRATSIVTRDGKVEAVPVGGLALSGIRNYLKSTLRYLDCENHVLVDYKIKQGSVDLMSIYSEKGKLPSSNDTSVGVGFYPFTDTERLVLETERMLNSAALKKKLPEVGEDIKVMALRRGKKINLTVAAATISSLVRDKSHYASVMKEATGKVEDLASKLTQLDVSVKINAGDSYSKGIYYLTVTGTSAEAGDDGNTGRGNRPNGIISPMRQYSMEATAGKNPVSHTGKLFNVLAQKASEKIYNEVNGVREVYVRILSKIGAPIDTPQVASAAVVMDNGKMVPRVVSDVKSILTSELSKVTSVTELILKGQATLF